MTLIDKIVHYIFLLLILAVFKLVFLSFKVDKKVILCCIISILVLMTHMLSSCWFVLVLLSECFSKTSKDLKKLVWEISSFVKVSSFSNQKNYFLKTKIFHFEFKKKSRVRETKHLSTDADSSTDTTVGWTKNTQNTRFFWKMGKKTSKTQKLKKV